MQQSLHKKILLSILVLFSLMYAQTDSTIKRQTVGLTAGLGTSTFIITGGLDLKMSLDSYGISAGMISGINPVFNSDIHRSTNYIDRRLVFHFVTDYISIGAGISLIELNLEGAYISAEPFGHYEKISRNILGLPLEANLYLNSSFIGLNAKFFSNVNSEYIVSGLLIGLSIGKLK